MPKPTPLAPPTPTHVPRELYTIPETMRALSVSRDTVYKLIDAAELPTVKIGRAVRIPHAAIVALVDARTSTGNGRTPRARARKRAG